MILYFCVFQVILILFLGIGLFVFFIKCYEGILNFVLVKEKVKYCFLVLFLKINVSSDIRFFGLKILDFFFIKGNSRLNVFCVFELQGFILYLFQEMSYNYFRKINVVYVNYNNYILVESIFVNILYIIQNLLL